MSQLLVILSEVHLELPSLLRRLLHFDDVQRILIFSPHYLVVWPDSVKDIDFLLHRDIAAFLARTLQHVIEHFAHKLARLLLNLMRFVLTTQPVLFILQSLD